MIDLLKNYKELRNSSGYIGTLRYEIAKKKIDTLFVKWLSNHQQKVEELFEKAKNGTLEPNDEPKPLFNPRAFPAQNPSNIPSSPMPMMNSTITTPPRGLDLAESNQRMSFHETYTPQNLTRSTYLMKSIPQDMKINTEEIPQFYFPEGKALDDRTQEQQRDLIRTIYQEGGQDLLKRLVIEVLGLPCYFSIFLFKLYHKGAGNFLAEKEFFQAWQELKNKQISKRAFLLLSSDVNKKYLIMDDFKELMKQILQSHEGLNFLKQTPQFQEWYTICVINRMFFIANEKNDLKMTFREFKKSTILRSLFQIETEPDINQNRSFFCYEDFYVIYIKFWELDTDHDFLLTKEELSKYSGYTLSRKAVERVFSQVARQFQDPERMTFGDFVWFIYCVEDKTHPRSIEYWFKILDLDSNGIVTGYQIETFFEEQSQRLNYTQNASTDFNYQNVICQMVDLLKPKQSLQFTLQDFLKCKNECGIFLNFLMDLNKLLAYEQRDAYEERNQKVSHPDWTQWQRFVKPEYKRVEEGQQVINWENDQ